MVDEHALTVKGEITMQQLEYLVKKANELGESGREVFRVFCHQEGEEKHIYFEVDSMRGVYKMLGVL